jgi:hypothetical protein
VLHGRQQPHLELRIEKKRTSKTNSKTKNETFIPDVIVCNFDTVGKEVGNGVGAGESPRVLLNGGGGLLTCCIESKAIE